MSNSFSGRSRWKLKLNLIKWNRTGSCNRCLKQLTFREKCEIDELDKTSPKSSITFLKVELENWNKT